MLKLKCLVPALLLPAIASAQSGNSAWADKYLRIGKPVPQMTGKDQSGHPFKLSSYRGKVVVLDFFGFW
jgi:cytochrome oxidase Cu insertion factor (SCO1/SenC/PrrC family)